MKPRSEKKVVPFDVMMRNFKNYVEESGILNDVRAKEFYEKPTTKRKRKKMAAVSRERRRVSDQQASKRLY
tara:strand:+ start:515 stop:727 length:213 start_codon:yes stop_codon:yes gene_type:complete